MSSFLHLERLAVHDLIDAVLFLRRIHSEHLRILEVRQTVKRHSYKDMLAHLAREGREIEGILSQPMFRNLRRVSLTIVIRYYV